MVRNKLMYYRMSICSIFYTVVAIHSTVYKIIRLLTTALLIYSKWNPPSLSVLKFLLYYPFNYFFPILFLLVVVLDFNVVGIGQLYFTIDFFF